MNVTIIPHPLRGAVKAPQSRGETLLMMLCAALSGGGESRIEGAAICRETAVLADCLRRLGLRVTQEGVNFAIAGTPTAERPLTLDCQDSAEALRLLTPLAAALGGGITFVRPQNDHGCSLNALLQVIHGFGLTVEKTETGFTLCGKATPHEYMVGSGVDAYGLAGLLLSLPLLGAGAGIRVIGGVLPDLAVIQRIMRLFGVEVLSTDSVLTASGSYAPQTAAADGDWFAALNWLVGGVIGGILRVENLRDEGEGIFAIEWLEYIGGILDKRNGAVRSTHGRLRSGKFDASRRADIVPILAVAASFARGTSVFTVNPALYKEYGKVLSGTADMIRELGGVARDDENVLRVRGVPLRGGDVDAKGDCRIAMAAAIAASRTLNPVTIHGAECVLEQYPTFFDDYKAVNGRITIE